MLDKAKEMLNQILHALQDEILEEIPIVGLEPSCVAVFRDELCNLIPNDENAKRLKANVFTLAEFLEKKTSGFELPKLEGSAIVHSHCHHKAIMKTEADESVLKKMGLDVRFLSSFNIRALTQDKMQTHLYQPLLTQNKS